MHDGLWDFCTHSDIYRYSIFDFITFYTIEFISRSHDICFANAFDSFIHVIILKALKFKPSVLFGTHTLFDRSLRSCIYIS